LSVVTLDQIDESRTLKEDQVYGRNRDGLVLQSNQLFEG